MSQEANRPLVGADPEFFLVNAISNNVVPVFGLVGGTKESPLPIPGIPTDGYAMQEDGAAFEFNVPPAPDVPSFVRSIRTVQDTLYARVLHPINHGIAASVHSITLNPEQLAHKQAQTIGCSKDYTAYPKDGNHERAPFTAQDLGNQRFAGGHFHIQYNKEAMPEWAAARFLDIYAGLPMVYHDRQHGRRKFYGCPGLYRPKPYGIEYRTLSNSWLFVSRDRLTVLVGNIFRFAQLTYSQSGIESLHSAFESTNWDNVQQAIAQEDTDLAGRTLERFMDSTALRVDFV